MDLRAITDRIEITDLLTRYARAVDRRDWDLYRTVFTPGARIDYTSAGGIEAGVHEMCDWLKSALSMFESTQHMVSNVDISIGGDTAEVEAMFHNPMKLPDGNVWLTGGWYHHRLVRTAGGWLSESLIEESSYMSTDQ